MHDLVRKVLQLFGIMSSSESLEGSARWSAYPKQKNRRREAWVCGFYIGRDGRRDILPVTG
jgi:hypothetical protein